MAHPLEHTLPLPADALSLDGLTKLHHIIIWCDNGDVIVDKYCNKLGFAHIATKRDVGEFDRVEHYLKLSDCHVVIVSPTRFDDSEMLDFVKARGDAVRDFAFAVTDMEGVLKHLVEAGCTVVQEPTRMVDSDGEATVATVTHEVLTGITHTLVDDSKFTGTFLPGFELEDNIDTVSSTASSTKDTTPLLDFIDHVAFACHRHKMHETATFYCKAFGFSRYMCDEEDEDGLQVTGMNNGLLATTLALKPNTHPEVFKLVVVEPADDTESNQIRQFVERNGNNCGVQHVAFHTKDIAATVRVWSRMGTRFIKVPPAYYQLRSNQGYRDFLEENLDDLAQLSILADVTTASQEAYAHMKVADKSNHGNGSQLMDPSKSCYILQIFTTTVSQNDSMFLELVSRHGSFGFGKGNIKALFEAVEKQQELEKESNVHNNDALTQTTTSSIEVDASSPIGGR
eukprot:TRINITY_DN2067_c0_g1_i10.p1 TRINITY_DN2067_c0_g1~~TRINITY_DN2067_c0_g1_i10.p1  ORF type:complete len:455 (+),score=106.81 TRINITY_DN2067_c0_g1_i10:420-1784(+)